jgi:hypothetical protein
LNGGQEDASGGERDGIACRSNAQAGAGLVDASVASGGTVVAVALALLLGWHVFNGKNGVSVW